MNNASKIAVPILYKPRDPAYAESIRQFQGCPTLAVTPGGRIYLGWYSGGTREPHMENYNLVIYSDDRGKTWSEPLLVIPSSKALQIHALDIQLWTDPQGALHVFWVQNNTEPVPETLPAHASGQPLAVVDGWMFGDFTHACWEMVCRNPDDDEPAFSAPRYFDSGFLRCKPTVLDTGRILYFNYDQMHPRYGYSISDDGGKTVRRAYGAEKIATRFDEAMAYQRLDGSVRMLARTITGELAESVSRDRGETWEPARPSGIDNPSTRFWIARTPSGRVLLVNNDARDSRRNMTVYLSEDDGATWKYKRCIDTRDSLSYPDADFYDGRICLTYDRERTGAKEILFLSFTEDDIVKGTGDLTPQIVSKP